MSLIRLQRSAAGAVCAAGDRVYYPGSAFMPGEGRCLCLFKARDETVLASLNRGARLPAKRIVPEVMSLTSKPIV